MNELLKAIAGLTKTLNVIDERFKGIEKDISGVREDVSELRKEVAELRKENYSLAQRVTALEAGRATVAAEVKTALVETMGLFKLEMEREAAARQHQQDQEEIARLRRQIPARSGGEESGR